MCTSLVPAFLVASMTYDPGMPLKGTRMVAEMAMIQRDML